MIFATQGQYIKRFHEDKNTSKLYSRDFIKIFNKNQNATFVQIVAFGARPGMVCYLLDFPIFIHLSSRVQTRAGRTGEDEVT
jgi:hypothetical protein